MPPPRLAALKGNVPSDEKVETLCSLARMRSKSSREAPVRSTPRGFLINSKKLKAGVSLNTQGLMVTHCGQRVNNLAPTQRGDKNVPYL